MFANMKKATGKILVSLIVFTLLFSFWTSSIAGAATIDPNASAELTLSKELSRSKILLDGEFTITYKIQPKSIPESVVTKPEKEIFLVIDTSGSMEYYLNGTTRLNVARKAASKFLDNLAGKQGVKVGLITYDNFAKLKQNLTADLNSIKRSMNNLYAEGGTNIGDGMRLAYYKLNANKSTSEKPIDKYLILLTDGEPTYHSKYKRATYSSYFYMGDKDWYDNVYTYDGGGSFSTENDKLYCYKVASELLAPSGIKSYMIAFTSGSNANVLSEIARRAGGIYERAQDSNDAKTLEEVYEDIYKDIIVDFSVQNIKFEETFPEGLEVVSVPQGFSVNGQTVTGNLSDIKYSYDKASKTYKADAIEFSIKVKGNLGGKYELNTSKLTYKDINGNNKTVKPVKKNVEVVALQADLELGRSLSKEEFLNIEQFNVSYTIKPKDLVIDPDLEAPSQLFVKNLYFTEEFPEGLKLVSASNGLTITGQKVAGNLGNIIYHYDNASGKYKADPITFNVKLYGNEGQYTLGNNNTSKVKYTDLDKQNKEKYFPELNATIVKYEFGKPQLEVLNVTRKGENVEITLRITLPDHSEYGELRVPAVNGDGSIVKVVDNNTLEHKVTSKTETYIFRGSMFKTHRVWLRAVSDFDPDTTSETDIITIFDAININ